MKVYGLPEGQGLDRRHDMARAAGGPGPGQRVVHKPLSCPKMELNVRFPVVHVVNGILIPWKQIKYIYRSDAKVLKLRIFSNVLSSLKMSITDTVKE